MARLSTARLVSWDLDGTLYALPAVMRALRWRIARRPWVYWEVRRLVQLYKEAGARRPKVSLDEAARQLRRQLEAKHLCPALSRVGVSPAAEALWRAFAERSVTQVVLSDYPAVEKLEALGLGGRFARVYAAEDLGALKPEPALLLRVASDFGLAPHEVLHIGDRHDTDGRMAAAVGAGYLHIGAGLQELAAALRES